MPRHKFESVPVHPTAIMMGADCGLTLRSLKEIIAMAQEAMPMLLIGGYHTDLIIIAAVIALQDEDAYQLHGDTEGSWRDVDRDKIMEHIVIAMTALYGNVV